MVGMQIWFWSLLQIESLQWIGGGSNIVDALRSVRLDVLGSVSNRPGVEDIVIVMIGGRSDSTYKS